MNQLINIWEKLGHDRENTTVVVLAFMNFDNSPSLHIFSQRIRAKKM